LSVVGFDLGTATDLGFGTVSVASAGDDPTFDLVFNGSWLGMFGGRPPSEKLFGA